MDQNLSEFDDNLKNEVKLKLTDTFILGLKEKKLTLKDMKNSCIYILDNINNINNISQLIVFLDDLKSRWPVYEEVFIFYKANLSQRKEQLVINKLSQYFKHLS